MRRTHASPWNLATAGYCYAPGALDALEIAATKLGTLPETLRALCELRADRENDIAVAHLGHGVVGIFSLGTWHFRFPLRFAVARSGEIAFQ